MLQVLRKSIALLLIQASLEMAQQNASDLKKIIESINNTEEMPLTEKKGM
ncbi:MAG: hypothetical protein KAS13_08045 [Candidatus Omnitrophica bacterium]|nr:hypothetical protein [Candidatus Omnitrophota bacterium]